MPKQQIVDEVTAFLDQIPQLSVSDFERINEAELKAYPILKEAQSLLRLSAADFSWLDKRVREVVGPLLVSLEWPSKLLSSGVRVYVVDAAQAIVRRDRLTPQQYEAYVGGFRQVGITIPVHPSEVNDSTGKVASV